MILSHGEPCTLPEGPAKYAGPFRLPRPRGCVAVIDLDVDLQTTHWTVAQAAEAAGVKPNVVRNWKYRGVLTEAGRDWRGGPLFLAIDVIRAEKATRERARRTYAAA